MGQGRLQSQVRNDALLSKARGDCDFYLLARWMSIAGQNRFELPPTWCRKLLLELKPEACEGRLVTVVCGQN